MHGVKETFDAIASRYDNQRRWIIPDLQGFYGAAVWAAALPAKSPSILEFGVGTGLLSGLLLDAYPRASITLMDISEKMHRGSKGPVRWEGGCLLRRCRLPA